VRRAILVHVKPRAADFPAPALRRPGVIQMDVREQQGVKIAHRQVALPQLLRRVSRVDPGPGSNDRAMAFRFQKGARWSADALSKDCRVW